ncbi:NDR1/HIN1-like protein 13 [Pyrus x bretschneideri]|uniref:NDR1/HIN1-like protein 13 n=1 Tax=Pyrus x bretschneideri TaxID=225117 RepID=UPI002030B325|nr:NDR1/HIN1-like protein 13 [Pyrus x bretschneideri]
MEERGPPAAAAGDDDGNEDPPQSEMQLVLRPPPPPFPGENTYVVQIPKDQIYRVPPPENALIVERHRNPENKKSSCCTIRCLIIGAIVFSLCLILSITLLSLSLTVKPKEPKFSISNVHVKNPKSKSDTGKNLHPGYEVSLKVNNPNGHGINYEGSEGASLLLKEKRIGKGKFPLKKQEKDSSATVKLVLDGSKGALPREVEKSIENTNSKMHLPLTLKMDLSVKVKGFIKTWKMETEVECHFQVNTLGKGTEVLQQKCEAKFKG